MGVTSTSETSQKRNGRLRHGVQKNAGGTERQPTATGEPTDARRMADVADQTASATCRELAGKERLLDKEQEETSTATSHEMSVGLPSVIKRPQPQCWGTWQAGHAECERCEAVSICSEKRPWTDMLLEITYNECLRDLKGIDAMVAELATADGRCLERVGSYLA